MHACPLCGLETKNRHFNTAGTRAVDCERCGRYDITLEASEDLTSEQKTWLPCSTRQGSERGVRILIRTDNWQTLSAAHSESSIPENSTGFYSISRAVLLDREVWLESDLRSTIPLPTEGTPTPSFYTASPWSDLQHRFILGSSGESVGSTTALDGNSDANETETTESTVRARLDSKSL